MRKVRWTFNLPNFQGRYLKQGTVGTYGSESLPNIVDNTDVYFINAKNDTSNIGAITLITHFLVGESPAGVSTNTNTGRVDISFDASRSSSTYQNNAKVNPDNAEIMYVIKF